MGLPRCPLPTWLAAEFPPQALSGEVLRAIGSGERTFSNIARSAGGLAHTSLTRAMQVLTDKGIVAAELPVSLRPSKERRYRIAGTQDIRTQSLLLGYRLLRTGWRLVELRIVG